MNLPKFKTPDRQLRLFPQPIKSMGELRWAVGEFYENLTAELSGARRMRTDSRVSVCPDLQYAPRVFFETKGVGKTGKVILYAGRQTKYSEFAAAGNEIQHWIWSHNFRASNAKTYPDSYLNLAAHTRELLIVDFEFLLEQCAEVAPVLINSQYNKQNKGSGYHENAMYGTGWTIPLHKMREQLFRRAGFLAGGRFPVSGVTVYCSRAAFGDYLP